MSSVTVAKLEFLRLVEASLIAKPAPKNQDLILQRLRQKKLALIAAG